MRKVTLSAIQPANQRAGAIPDEQKADNIQIAFSLMEEAAKGGADLICLPETFPMTGLARDEEVALRLADEEGGTLSRDLCTFAREHRVNIIAPVLGRYETIVRNVAWVISRDGEHLGRYFKVHCTHRERQQGIVPGGDWPVFPLDCGRIGVMICHDNCFPESARCLALNGADVICWPHVQSGWGDVVWDITLRSRAIDNGVYLLSACYGIPDNEAWRPGMMVGRSGVVGPDGTVLVDSGRNPGVVATTIDLDHVLLKHNFTWPGPLDFRASMLATRRPETYAPLVDSGR